MASDFEYFVKSCEEFDYIVHRLEECETCSLYMIYKSYEFKNNFYRTEPTYFVFSEGKEILNTKNYLYAYNCYKSQR